VKILVLGSKGQLGTALMQAKTYHEVVRAEPIDICDSYKLKVAIESIQPNVIINCAAYTNVLKAENQPGECFAINARGVHNIATLCAVNNIELIQISSDYVFSGNTHAWPYKENSSLGPIQTYGVSKVASEVITKNTVAKYKIFRTSALFGTNPNKTKGTFIKTVLDKVTKGEIANVYDHHRISVGYAPHIANCILNTLTIKTNGVYHAVNEGYTSWYNFALTALKVFPNYSSLLSNLKIKPFDEEAAKEIRPRYSALKNSLLPLLPHFTDAIDEYVKLTYAKEFS
jgi:dTDP-4-dehydrorhamnose reductase